MDVPGGSDGKASAYNVGDPGSIPGSGRSPGEGNGNPLQYSCPENHMDGGAWKAAVHGVAKNLTWLSDFTFTLHFHASEKEMATHSSVLAWRIPGMGEPGGLPSMGSHSRTRLKWLSSSSSRLKRKYGISRDFLSDHIFLDKPLSPQLHRPLTYSTLIWRKLFCLQG